MESKLISLVSEILSLCNSLDLESKFIAIITQIISLVSSTDLESWPKPESKLISLTTQIVYLLRSMDLDSQPKPLSKLISLISQKISTEETTNSDSGPKPEFMSLVADILSLEPEPELISLIHQTFSHVVFMNSKWKKLVSLCLQAEVKLEEVLWSSSNGKWACLPLNWMKFRLTGEDDATHFLCRGCNGENHEEHEKAPVEIKHPFHPKHSLQLLLFDVDSRTRKCYCCDEDLREVFYHCSSCDFAMNIACVEKPPLLAINDPKWHEHTLILFPRQDFLTCNVCALADSSSPIYMCLPCGFVVHLACISLPRVIRISPHLHRISFTPSFDQVGCWSCGVCRRKMDNDYGGYSCNNNGCCYVAHSRCATQSSMWDGKELEGEFEDIEEEELIEPFVRITDGIIQHFSHERHHLRLDVNSWRDYDENKVCRACILPIFSGDFYSCKQCDFILHEKCANLSRTIYHPTHPHVLTLVGEYDGVVNTKISCSACSLLCTGFFYQCDEDGCNFHKLHVQCATISEPLSHEIHVHPLFLTSIPGEWRTCSVCKDSRDKETFICNECDDFALCFACATLPQQVRYTDDSHMLTLSYGEESSSMTYWCEICERQLNPKKPFYKCGQYCCVTLHIKCLLEWSFT